MVSDTIYRSPAAEAEVFDIYDELLSEWPVDYRQTRVPSAFGSVHVIVSGPDDGPPVMLLHAASMASTSWLPNIAALTAAGFRTYAVDHIGEAGQSRLDDLKSFPRSGVEIGELYRSVAYELGLSRAAVVAASAGGHAALRFALAAPETVTRLALLGPMGIVPLGLSTGLKMMMVSMFPSDARVARTNVWALGSSPSVQEKLGPWFEAVLRAIASPPKVGRPVALTSAEKSTISSPVLLVLGTRDNLVGNPAKAVRAAKVFPDLRTEVLDTAHLIAVEQADAVNALLVEFLEGDRT